MRRPVLFWLVYFISCLGLFASCTKFETKDNERKEREELRTIIISLYPKSLPIEIQLFKNQTGLTDLSYLEQGIPSLIADEIRPIENDKTYIDYRKFPVEIPSNMIVLLSKSNTQFSNYILTTITISTQTKPPVESNQITNVMTNAVSFDTSSKPSILTNLIWMMTTNAITNQITTNTQVSLPLSNYYLLIETVYPDLTNQLSMYSMELILTTNRASVTNQTNRTSMTNITNTNNFSTNTESSSNERPKYYFILSGSYNLNGKKVPYDLSIRLNLSNVNFPGLSFEKTARSREDQLTSLPQKFHKDIRHAILNRTGGDLWIESDPAGANVYLNGSYIGKSPLLFPEVPEGEQFITLLKEKYQQVSFKTVINRDKTNAVKLSMTLFETGGTVSITSGPTNSKVYLDSYFQGSTPIVLSNLSLGIGHRLKIEPVLTNLYPAYTNVLIRQPGENYHFHFEHLSYEGSSTSWKDTLWWATYGSWFLTLGSIGLWITGHAISQHYYDLYSLSGNSEDWNQYQVYNNLANVGTYSFYITGVLSMGMTAWALTTEEIQLGQAVPAKQDWVYGVSLAYRF